MVAPKLEGSGQRAGWSLRPNAAVPLELPPRAPSSWDSVCLSSCIYLSICMITIDTRHKIPHVQPSLASSCRFSQMKRLQAVRQYTVKYDSSIYIDKDREELEWIDQTALKHTISPALLYPGDV